MKNSFLQEMERFRSYVRREKCDSRLTYISILVLHSPNLNKCIEFQRVPPIQVDDLIEDLKDGTRLLALLEVLSGEKLPVERGRNLKRPHFLSNVNTALQFLQSKKVSARGFLLAVSKADSKILIIFRSN